MIELSQINVENKVGDIVHMGPLYFFILPVYKSRFTKYLG